MSDQQGGMEHMEALYRGRQGDKGDRGEKGVSKLPSRLAWALVVLFVVAAAMGGTALFASADARNAAAAAVRQSDRKAAAQEAAQRRASALIEAKICADVTTMSLIPPPAGNPASNPSRAYEQAEHRAWTGLVAGIGCKTGAP